MVNPLSLRHFYLRNKRKVIPVIGILALAIVGVVVTDSLLASARQTAYATFSSYQKLILVAPRATRDQDLANPLQQSLAQLKEVQAGVDALAGDQGISAYYASLSTLPLELRARVPALDQLQRDAGNSRYYAARLRGDLTPLAQLITRVQRLQAEEQAFSRLADRLAQNPRDPAALISYLQNHQTWLRSLLPDISQLGQLQAAVTNASADLQGLQRSLEAANRDAASLNARSFSLPPIPPPPPSPEAQLRQFQASLDQLGQTLSSFEAPQADIDKLVAASRQIAGTDFAQADAYSNLNVNMLAGNAQFDLYGVSGSGMQQLLGLYGDRLKAGRLPRQTASEIALSEEVARSKGVGIGGQVGNSFDELDRLPDAFTVVGILEGPARVGLIPFDYMTQHYLFERRYEGLVVAPLAGHELQVHQALEQLVAGKPFRLFDWPYIKAKIDSLIQNLDTINRFLILLVTIVLSLVVGLLNNLFFKQRMNEFGLLAAIGYARWRLIGRVAWESLGVTLAAWVVGLGLGIGILSWFNQSFIVPHGLLMNVFDWGLLLSHTLPIPLMVFIFGMGTVAWQLLRLDPISIIERRD
ncbi:MAG: FtsX-like permease family protein [Chloroflexi bacterium]|nr:MAG: FtsX-like permease family protein [Chloroflexota bacterium]